MSVCQQTGAYYDYPDEVDPAAEFILVQECREGVVTQVEFPRLTYDDLPPVASKCGTRGYCFGEIGSDTRQIFLHYDSEGHAKALFAYRDGIWGWQFIGKYREQEEYGLLLRFSSNFLLRAFQRAVQQAMATGESKSVPLFVEELQGVPDRVPITGD